MSRVHVRLAGVPEEVAQVARLVSAQSGLVVESQSPQRPSGPSVSVDLVLRVLTLDEQLQAVSNAVRAARQVFG
jgi:hypothetical protein